MNAPFARRLALQAIGFGLLFIGLAATQLYVQIRVDKDVWWTPAEQALTLSAATDRVTVTVDGAPMEQLMLESRLLRTTADNATPTPVGEVRLRFNNASAVQASRIPALIVGSALGGAGLLALLLGVVAWMSSREHGNAASRGER